MGSKLVAGTVMALFAPTALPRSTDETVICVASWSGSLFVAMARSRLSCQVAGSSWPTTETHCWKRSMNPAQHRSQAQSIRSEPAPRMRVPQSGDARMIQTPFHVLPFEMAMIPRISVINRIGTMMIQTPNPNPGMHAPMQANTRRIHAAMDALLDSRGGFGAANTCVVAWIGCMGGATAAPRFWPHNLGKTQPRAISPHRIAHKTCFPLLSHHRIDSRQSVARSRFC